MDPAGKLTTRGRVLVAAVTPLASILGSGLLIIVPVLERTLGALSVLGAAGVCAVAWLVGTAVARHGSSSVNGGRFTPPGAAKVGLYETRDGGKTWQLRYKDRGQE